MMVLDKEDGRWRAGVPAPPPLAPRGGAREHPPGVRAHAPGSAGAAELLAACSGTGGHAAPGSGREPSAGRVLRGGAARRLRRPDLHAAAARVERLVSAAAALRAAITLRPPRNPRGAERRTNQRLGGDQTPELGSELERGRTAPSPGCLARQRKTGWALGGQLPTSVTREKDASPVGPPSLSP